MVIQRETQEIEVPPRRVQTRGKFVEKDEPGWISTKSLDRFEEVITCLDDSLKSHNLANTATRADESTEVKDLSDNKLVKVQSGVVSVIENDFRLDDKQLQSIRAVVSRNIKKTLKRRHYLGRLCSKLSKKANYEIIVDGDWPCVKFLASVTVEGYGHIREEADFTKKSWRDSREIY